MFKSLLPELKKPEQKLKVGEIRVGSQEKGKGKEDDLSLRVDLLLLPSGNGTLKLTRFSIDYSRFLLVNLLR